jgi:hypothetical protein
MVVMQKRPTEDGLGGETGLVFLCPNSMEYF